MGEDKAMKLVPSPRLARRFFAKSALLLVVANLLGAGRRAAATTRPITATGKSEIPSTQYLRDRAAIQDLAIFYSVSCDSGQLDDTVNCWVPAGVFDESASGFGRISGHEELRRFFQLKVFDNVQVTVHLTSNHYIKDIGDRCANGIVFTLIEVVRRDGIRSRVQGCYHDEYAKTEKGWKFKSRIFQMNFPREVVNAGS
jgi:hypothetical protein